MPWQPGPPEVAEGEPSGMALIVSVPMAPIENLPAVPVVKPRECRALRFSIRREVLRAATRAQLGAEAKPRSTLGRP